ncbi:MAG: rod shape-determining protein RodA [Candidatus Omnitrophica bacterium]|nr:rod shape-determining protein RodA [Candidatus Omnitrophota bacterium]
MKLFKLLHVKLFFFCLLIGLVGVLNIYSADAHAGGQFALKQLVWLSVAVGVMFVVYAIGYRPFLNAAFLLYLLAIALLGIVLVIGVIRGGAQRWIRFGPVGIQPSEFAKLVMILTLSSFLGSRKDLAKGKSGLVAAFLLTVIPLIMIVKQPDLGTALIFLPVLFCMLFVWGAKLRYLIGTVMLGGFFAPIFWFSLKEYQKRRLLVFINPDIDPLGAGYTAVQSKIAVGSGGLVGKGFLGGTQHLLAFLPEDHTDFIFGVLAEEWGFLGSILLLLLYVMIIWQMFSILEHTTDIKARLLATGIIAMFVFHIFINVGMTVGIMPITGLPLPMVSYGGSSLVTFFVAIGLVLSIYKERSVF